MTAQYAPHACDFCEGTVRPVIADQEPIRLRGTIVLLSGFTIGKCDRCGHRYFPVDVVKRADAAAQQPQDVLTIPVVRAA